MYGPCGAIQVGGSLRLRLTAPGLEPPHANRKRAVKTKSTIRQTDKPRMNDFSCDAPVNFSTAIGGSQVTNVQQRSRKLDFGNIPVIRPQLLPLRFPPISRERS